METVEDSVPEHMKCPICYHLPRGKVFQCKDGHLICEDCYKSVTLCPQCRAVYGAEGIRCRLLEDMLDNLKIECPFKELGCDETLTRNNLDTHAEECQHSPFRRRSTDFCKFLGYTDCNFRVCEDRVADAIRHFQQEHELCVEKSSCGILEYCGFANNIANPADSNTNLAVWKPVVIANPEENSAVLLVTVWDRSNCPTVSWIAIGIDCIPTAEVEFYCVNEDDKEVNTESVFLKWSSGIINSMDVKEELAELHTIRIPALKLKEACTTYGSLCVQFTLKERESTGGKSASRIYILPELRDLKANALSPPQSDTTPPPPPINEIFIGKFELTSSDKKFSAYLKASGVPEDKRKLWEKSNHIIEIVKNSGHYELITSTVFGHSATRFRPGEMVVEQSNGGSTVERIIFKERNKLTQIELLVGSNESISSTKRITREFFPCGMKSILSAHGVTTMCTYKRLF